MARNELIFVLMVVGFIIFLSIGSPFIRLYFSENLYDIDRESFFICQSVAQNKLFTKGRVEFLVNKNAPLGVYVHPHKCPFFKKFFKNKVFLHPKLLKVDRNFLRTAIAHELGHIEYETGDQIKADYFAVLIFGEEAVLERLSHLEKNNPNINMDEINRRKAALKKK